MIGDTATTFSIQCFCLKFERCYGMASLSPISCSMDAVFKRALPLKTIEFRSFKIVLALGESKKSFAMRP